MNNKLIVTILTMGTNPELFSKLKELEVFFRELEIDFEIKISLNLRKSSTGNFQEIQGYETIKYDKFHNSVEEHLHHYLQFEHSQAAKNALIFPISDNDHYVLKNLIKVFQNDIWKSNDLIFLNHSFGSKTKIPSDLTIFVNDNKQDIHNIILNSGFTHGAAKLGAWLVSTNILTSKSLKVWNTWLESTVLFTHSYFFVMLAQDNLPMTYFENRNCLITEVNPTDEDRTKVWFKYYDKQNRIFQQDWTFGQLFLLSELLRLKIFTKDQIRASVISCSQRGVLPLISDLIWRIVVNQSKFIYLKNRIDSALINSSLEFLSEVWPEFSHFSRRVRELKSSDKKKALRAFKELPDIWHEIDMSKWGHLHHMREGAFEIYQRSHSFVAIRKGFPVDIAFRDSSQTLSNSDVYHSNSIEEITSWIKVSKKYDPFQGYILKTWNASKNDYFLKTPAMQKILIRYFPERLRIRLFQKLKRLRRVRYFFRF